MALSHRRFAIAAAAPAALAIAAALLPPFAQDPRYHAFADARTLCGMPNFSNVISNLPFLAVALCGLYTGMKVGFTAAPLALAMLVLPPAAGFLLFPTEDRWNRALGD